MEDKIIKHVEFNVLKDAVANQWDKVSLWTKAKDVETNDENNLETKRQTVDTTISESGLSTVVAELQEVDSFIDTANKFVAENELDSNMAIADYSKEKCAKTLDNINAYYTDTTRQSLLPLQYGLEYDINAYSATKKGLTLGHGFVQVVSQGTTGGGSGSITLKNDYAAIIVILFNPSAAPRIAYKPYGSSTTPTPTARTSSDRVTVYCRDKCYVGDTIILSHTYGFRVLGIAANYYPWGDEVPTNIDDILSTE